MMIGDRLIYIVRSRLVKDPNQVYLNIIIIDSEEIEYMLTLIQVKQIDIYHTIYK